MTSYCLSITSEPPNFTKESSCFAGCLIFPTFRLGFLDPGSSSLMIIGPGGAAGSGRWAGSAPHSTEVMCLPWLCPAALRRC